MASLSRRRFLEDSMLAATAAMAGAGASRVLAKETEQAGKSPNDMLSVAVIGVKGRGASHLAGFGDRNGARVTVICDADEEVGQKRCAEYEKKHGHKPKFVRDLRDVFDDKSVDIVSTATPNHWHALCAIWAIQAGKDVYVEKPVSHNVSEGRRIVEAARKYKKICQTGTQCRSMPGTIEAVQYVHDGKIGQLKVARGLCYKPRGSIGPKGNYPVPATVDYNLWSGPAPIEPVTRKQFHYDWHWFWDYGNGDLGNQGIHQMDIARWGVGSTELPKAVLSYGGRLGYEDAGQTANTQVVMHDYGDKSLVFEVRGLKTAPYRDAKVGVVFEGTDGYVVLTSYNDGAAFDRQGKMVLKFPTQKTKDVGNVHFDNFLKAVRSRNSGDLNADILEGHLSSALCHLGNISYRLGTKVSLGDAKSRLQGEEASDTFNRVVEHLHENNLPDATEIYFGEKLAINPQAETFVNNPSADLQLTRVYRAPFTVPAAGQV
ncbi:MAG TPA: Gfo/Idh/MocA family oxidoreductase [Pirellulales bacterium]|jgi:predicted dehydrogenase|nr:Gfo/Idh/MocA family oxidoreductase [Pirellulales bacterium]